MEPASDQDMKEENQQTMLSAMQQFGKRLFGFIRLRVNTPEDAEDILQDVYYQLANFTNIKELENVGAWLFRVARNRLTDSYRKQHTDLLDDFFDEDEEDGFNYKEVLLADDSQSPELAYLKSLFWEAFQKAVAQLPAKQREVYLLNEMEGLPLREIAERSGEPLKTIISRKGYAVKTLRKKLKTHYNEIIETL